MIVTVYGTPICPNCKNVISYLDSSNVSYKYETVGESVTKEQLEETVGRPVRAVPVIIVDGQEVNFEGLKSKVQTDTIDLASLSV